MAVTPTRHVVSAPGRSPVALALAGLCWSAGCLPQVCPDDGSIPEAEPLTPTAGAGLLAYAHAHNDYEHDRPLVDALDAGFHSVEADVWYASDRVRVSHDAVTFAGDLDELYLDPLQQLVDDGGTVLGDGEPFYLWLDLKEKDPDLRDELHALLADYPMLSTFEGDDVIEGPVTAILTGSAASKEAYVDEHTTRYACRDSNDFDPDDPSADAGWRYYALSWKKYVRWDGDGSPDDDTIERLRCIVGGAHDKGRGVRFYAAPESEEVWSASVDTGVEFIGTDELQQLHDFLEP